LTTAPPYPSSALLRDYRVPAGHYDELLESPGKPRPHWAAFFAHTRDIGPEDLTLAQQRIARQLHENGVTYNVHATGAPPRPWALDVLPHIVPAAEWEELSIALRQLARLLGAIAADTYGEQRLLSEGVIPPALVFGHRGFLRACYGFRPASGVYLQQVAFDLARGPDGVWRLMATRAQAPSGAGYALENRLTVSRVFPDAFREQHVSRLAPFFRSLQEMLLAGAPHEGTPPHIVLLTPGPFNETYFEHAYLSRYLGFTLVEGADLTARDDRVYLKTVTGLRPVHGILRRLDDDFCDQLELRADSTLGVPGLMQAWRAGKVMIANAFGMSVLESPALTAYLPAVCQHLFGEPLRVTLPASWWCGDRGGASAPLSRLHELMIKPSMPDPHSQAIDGASLDSSGHLAWIERIHMAPDRYVLEEYVPLSHAPVWHAGKLESRTLVMRVFLAADGHGDYHVLPGALSRIAGSERQVVSGQRGGGSKDTWVLSERPVERFSMLPGRLRIEDIVRSERMVSSRAGEHLFWMGRYAERSENSARLLRAVLSRIYQGDSLVSVGSETILATCRRHGLLPAAATKSSGAWSAQDFQQALIHGLFDTTTAHSLAFNVDQTVRVAGTVRDRLSTDNWRVLNQLSASLTGRPARALGLADALDVIDRAILSMVAVGGLEMAHMTRDDGWRFMSLGRHLERLLYVTTTVAQVKASDLFEDPALLEWLLDLSDSIITYRARYMGRGEWLAVADLLLFDGRNPRSAAFQLSKLAKHVPLLPDADLQALATGLERLAERRMVEPETLELFPHEDMIADFLESSEQLALHLSDALTLRYFSHVYEPARATLI
jgi:uncharacterized circularly permuted ATP-grasp superfamily protein/uncharacterized alpha-E superfamily protein